MNRTLIGLLLLCVWAPLPAWADDNTNAGNPPAADSFSYSDLEPNRLREHSDYFGDTAAGTGFRFSYDFPGEVYLLGQWNHLKFDTLAAHRDLTGVGIGAHQAYNDKLSFYVDLSFMQDRFSSSTASATDDFWRLNYGFRGHMSDLLELDGAIFTERNTIFGARPFGERLGLGLDFSVLSLLLAAEHTANGNRSELSLVWAYR
jgi:hypothetical protein